MKSRIRSCFLQDPTVPDWRIESRNAERGGGECECACLSARWLFSSGFQWMLVLLVRGSRLVANACATPPVLRERYRLVMVLQQEAYHRHYTRTTLQPWTKGQLVITYSVYLRSGGWFRDHGCPVGSPRKFRPLGPGSTDGFPLDPNECQTFAFPPKPLDPRSGD